MSQVKTPEEAADVEFEMIKLRTKMAFSDMMKKKLPWEEILKVMSEIERDARELGLKPDDPTVVSMSELILTMAGWTATEFVTKMASHVSTYVENQLSGSVNDPMRPMN